MISNEIIDIPLNRCPFCGEEEELIIDFSTILNVSGNYKSEVICGNCGCKGPSINENDLEEADFNQRDSKGDEFEVSELIVKKSIEKWNTRS